MILYKQDGSILLDINVDDSSYRYREIMGDNVLVLNFSFNQYIDIPTGTYCMFRNDKYTLYSPDNFKKNHTENYEYTLTLESEMAQMKYVKFKFFIAERKGGQTVKMTNAPRLKFSYTANPTDFGQLLADNMELSGYSLGWKTGDMLKSEPVTLDFNHDDCFSVLTKVAEAFNTEWHVDARTISFGKVEKEPESAIPLSYGFNRGILPGVTRRQFDTSKVINRVWIQGGDRNIDANAYKSETLRLSQSATIRFDGKNFEDEADFDEKKAIEYITDELGYYVERKDRKGALSEDSLDVSKIYPHQSDTTVKTVGEEVVNTSDGKETWCYFTDPDNQIDYSECVIGDETMTVIFQSGMLTGKEFTTTYTHKDKKFLLRPVTENGYTYPDISDTGVVKPMSGDKYSVFHISMPQDLVEQAEREALKEAVKYLYDNEQPKYTYDWQLDGIFAKRREGTWSGMLSPGYFVRFSDPQFLPDAVNIRITAAKDYVNKPMSPEITLSNNVSGKSLGGILNEIPAKAQEIERSKNEAISYTKRRWKDTQDLINGLAGMTDEFKETLLSSLAFEGLVFRAGVPSLQFNFLKEDWDTATSPAIRYSEGKLSVEGQSRIRHDVMVIDGKTPCWLVDALAPYGGMDKDKTYYLYIEASKELEEVDERWQGKANFLVSEEQIKLEDRDGYYTFWVAFISSENDLEERSIRTMCGYTEILPGQITTDMLISRDGNSYLDLMDNQMQLTNGKEDKPDEQSLVWKDGKLTITNASIKNALNVDGEADISGFKFSNEIIRSTATVNLNPAIKLDGKAGFIELISKDSGTAEDGVDEEASINKSTTITVSSSDGTVTARNSDGIAMLGANGIYANHAGQGLHKPSSGAKIYGAIVGVGKGDVAKSQYHDYNFIAGVIGKANNSNVTPAPAYGGWFEDLMVNGMILNTVTVQGANKETNIDRTTSFFVSLSENQQDVYLPDNAYKGTVIWLKQWSPGFIRVHPKSRQKLFDDSTENSYIDIGEGYTAMCVFIDNIQFSSDSNNDYGVWLLSKFKF